MFQDDQTKDHFFTCEGLFSLSFFLSLFWPVFALGFFSLHFPFSFSFWVSFLALLLCFCSLIFFQWCELNTFETPFFFTFAFQHQAFDRLSSREDFSLPLSPVWGWSLVGAFERNYQAQRGDYWIILYQWRDDERWSFLISNIIT